VVHDKAVCPSVYHIAWDYRFRLITKYSPSACYCELICGSICSAVLKELLKPTIQPVEHLPGVQEVVSSNPADGMTFFFVSYLLYAPSCSPTFNASYLSIQSTNQYEIRCPLSGNLNNIAANQYVALFVLYSALKALV